MIKSDFSIFYLSLSGLKIAATMKNKHTLLALNKGYIFLNIMKE